jgi:hypothetical protein
MRTAAIALGLFLGMAGPTAADETWLTGEQIRAALSNKTLIGDNYAKGMSVRIYSGANGEWWSRSDRGKVTKFEWHVKGDEHCKEEDGAMGCGPVATRGEPGVYYKYLKGKLRFKYTVLGDGNKI